MGTGEATEGIPVDARRAKAGGVLVGRSREMGILREALDAAWSGQSRLVLLSGEAGIGKTRLADAIADEARARGGRALWGRCWEAGGAPAYWPWVQIIRACLRDRDPRELAQALGNDASVLARIVPELRDVVPAPAEAPGPSNLPALPELEPGQSDDPRFGIFTAVTRLLNSIAAKSPLALVLDDLQAADEPSLLLLRFLAVDLADSRLLVLAIFREEDFETGDPRPALLADIARAPGAERLSPLGLTEAEVSRFIELTEPGVPAPGLAEAVHRETEGNPLFVGEVVRLLAEEGQLGRTRDAIGLPFGVPSGVRAVIGKRLGRLSDPCRELLGRASTFGVEVPLDQLARLAGQPAEDLMDLFDEASQVGVLLEPASPGGRWRFAHAMIRDVLYTALPASARLRLHRQIGELLETLGGEGEPPLTELAHHFLAAAVGPKALEYARRAAERATEQYAYEEAVRLYRLALEAGKPPDPERLQLLLPLGEAANRAGDQAAARSAFLEAAAIAEKIGSMEGLARAAVGYGGRFVWRRAGDDDRLVPLLEQGLEAVGPADSELRVRLLARLAGALRDEPGMARRDGLTAEAVAMGRRLGDPVILGHALISRYTAIMGPDALEEMADLGEEIRVLAGETGNRELLADGQLIVILLAWTLGLGTASRAEVERMGRIARELRQPSHAWFLAVQRTTLAFVEGRLADVEALLPKARREGDRGQAWDAEFAFLVGLFLLRREQGRLDEVADQIRRAIDRYPGYRFLPCMVVYADAAAGNDPNARRQLEEIARDDYAFLPRDWGWLFGMMFLGEAAISLGDGARADEIADRLRPYADLFATASGDGNGGPVNRVLGLLAAFRGDWDEGLGRLEAAERASAQMGARLWETRIAVERAAVLTRRGEPGDPAAARTLLERALETCRGLGLVAIESLASQLLVELGGGAAAGTAGGEPSIPGEPSFRREGEYWVIEFTRVVRLRDTKGLRYLAILLADPSREFHALDLAGRAEPAAGGSISAGEAAELGLRGESAAGAGDAIDAEARTAYRARLRELSSELEEAESFNDPARAERAREEMDVLEAELSAAFGLGGRSRPGISAAERARQSVTKAIRDALRRIGTEDAALGAHLSRSVRTGLYCIYDPDPASAPRWRI